MGCRSPAILVAELNVEIPNTVLNALKLFRRYQAVGIGPGVGRGFFVQKHAHPGDISG